MKGFAVIVKRSESLTLNTNDLRKEQVQNKEFFFYRSINEGKQQADQSPGFQAQVQGAEATGEALSAVKSL